MSEEIERKFLLKKPGVYEGEAAGDETILQGFLSTDPNKVLRIRITDGEKAFFTLKGKSKGAKRPEIETPMDLDAAREMMAFTENCHIDKKRFNVKIGSDLWQIDQYFGENEGLWTAEIEKETEEEVYAVALPDWIGEKITEDFRYSNSNLSKRPYKTF